MPPSRRRVLRLSGVGLAASLAGCASGVLDEESSTSGTTTTESTSRTTTDSATTDDPTTHAMGVETSLPEGTTEFPDGPKSWPERPDDLAAERVREYVTAFEYRWVYNRLYRDETTAVHAECGVDSVTEYGLGYRVVVWCSAWANTDTEEGTMHADYFKQYATYFVGADSTVRKEGEPE